MRITLDFRKTVEENASEYFEKSKKAKKKLQGAQKALTKSLEKLEKVKEKIVVEEQPNIKKIKRREWFEKFRWFVSSDGLLVIGGRDATTNEIVVKKHTDKTDVVFHTDMAGSPFIVVKSDGKKIPQSTLNEAADFTVTFSSAWKKGFVTTDVFYVKPEQVSKESNPGEYMAKGAFMIRGKTTYLKASVNLAVGQYDDKVMSGPIIAIKKNCKEYISIIQGDKKVSEVAKIIQKKIGGDLDEIIRALPPGNCDISRS